MKIKPREDAPITPRTPNEPHRVREGFYCQLWSDHDLKEGYYGYRCSKCDLFIPYGSEPWICEAGETITIDRFGERQP